MSYNDILSCEFTYYLPLSILFLKGNLLFFLNCISIIFKDIMELKLII